MADIPPFFNLLPTWLTHVGDKVGDKVGNKFSNFERIGQSLLSLKNTKTDK